MNGIALDASSPGLLKERQVFPYALMQCTKAIDCNLDQFPGIDPEIIIQASTAGYGAHAQ